MFKIKQFKIRSWTFDVRRSFYLFLFLFISFSSYGEDKKISVLSMNLWNYFIEGERCSPKKKESSRNAVAQCIASADPDIIMVSEIGGKKSLQDLLQRLKKLGIEYKYSDYMTGADTSRSLGIMAKLKPEKVNKVTHLRYKIRPKKDSKLPMESVPVQRGFHHVIFKKDDYKFHIINVHLKAKLFHPRYNHTDMRRLEARLLRYYVDDILEKNEDANILLVGDMNDVVNSDPIKVIKGDKLKEKRKLVDLKPADSKNLSWTHWYKEQDTYSRFDYSLVSKGLLSEVDLKKTRIIHIPEIWLLASDHRPLLTVIKCEEKAQKLETTGPILPSQSRSRGLPYSSGKK